MGEGLRTLGFTPSDFEVFKVEGFDQRMERIYEHVRPKLIRLSGELAPELTRKFHAEFFAHVARHARGTINPPEETWAAFGPSPKGYKRYGYLALCISRAGLQARAVVKSEAESRGEMARNLKNAAAQLEIDFRGSGLARFDKWDFKLPPPAAAANANFFETLADGLAKKTGGLDIGFGWTVEESVRLNHDELLDAFSEFEPLYRLLRAAA